MEKAVGKKADDAVKELNKVPVEPETPSVGKVNVTEETRAAGNNNAYQTSYAQSIEISEEKMYKLGSHFNKHGRNMGFGSKKEYETAARDFFQKNKNNAEIYVGKYNSPRGGILDGTEQVIIQYEGKSLVINKRNGQIIDFYDGIGMKAFVDLERKQ